MALHRVCIVPCCVDAGHIVSAEVYPLRIRRDIAELLRYVFYLDCQRVGVLFAVSESAKYGTAPASLNIQVSYCR